MSDFPQTHTTTTRTTTVTGSRIYFDVSYIKTIPGILGIVEVVLSLIVFICSVSACSWIRHGGCGWGGFVSFMAILLAVGFLCFHLFHVGETLPRVPWLLVEFAVYAIWTFMYLTAGIGLAVMSSRTAILNDIGIDGGAHAGSGAGAFFAFAAMLVFGFHTALLFINWRRDVGSSPQPAAGGHA